MNKRVLIIFIFSIFLIGGFLNTAKADAEWYDTGWPYRREITIASPCGSDTTEYQVQITLDSSFDFDHALPDGSDLRLTADDGLTIIPFWVEAWDPTGETASIWIRVPVLPAAGTVVYLYYGNPSPPPLLDDPEAVFSFFDDFNDGSFDTAKWSFDSGSTSHVSESGGLLTLTATAIYVKIHGQTTVGMDHIVEAYARHPWAGTALNRIAEVGFAGSTFDNIVRIADDFHNYTNWERQAKRVSEPDNWINMVQTVDTAWHVFRVYRLSPATAGFQIDDNPVETYISGNGTLVPTIDLPAFLMSYGSGNQFIVDWIRLRRYCGAEAGVTIGEEAFYFQDADSDGVFDFEDNCPLAANPLQEDADLDGVGDACDICPYDPEDDLDGDGVCGDVDNCPWTINPTQADSDSDGIGDTCDAEIWYRSAWPLRRSVPIHNPCGEACSDYQVRLELNADNFDFSKALLDGSDLRVTDSDGYTPIPFWIESWDAVGEQAVVWVKVPSIPLEGTVIYLYFNNPTPPGPVLVEMPPVGPWTRAAGNPIVPIGGPANGRSLLAENIVYDDVTGHYWMVLANYNTTSISLVYSDTPTDPASWYWHGDVIASANAPHILEHEGTWYIFYADRAHRASDMPGYAGPYPNSYPVSVATAASVGGPYTFNSIVLASTEVWEDYRVDEPYVFRRNDGTWILMYMGDSGPPVEQVSYATAADILGPYTKFPGYPADPGGPAIAFGPPGSFDAGTIADPWVVEFNEVYYIGYTVSPTTSSPWQTAMATTSDWQTFTKIGVIFPLGPTSAWDANNSFRGAVTRIGDTYVFPYTGDSYQMGIATQEVWQSAPLPVGPEAVFPFFDDFNDGSFDTSKWSFAMGSTSQVSENGGLLTLTATGTYIKIYGQTAVGMDHIVEAYAQHPQAGTSGLISEVGLAGYDFANTVRMADDFHNITYWERQVKDSSVVGDPWTNMAVPVDTDWHTFRAYRLSPATAGLQIDNNPVEIVTTAVPTVDLPAFLMSYGSGNQFIVDWIRVRSFCGAEAFSAIGAEDTYDNGPTSVTLLHLSATPTTNHWLPLALAGSTIAVVGLWLVASRRRRSFKVNQND